MQSEYDKRIYEVIKTLDERYERYHNLMVTNSRINKITSVSSSGRSNRAILEMLFEMGILSPYYEEESVKTAKVWKVNIKKVKKWLKSRK